MSNHQFEIGQTVYVKNVKHGFANPTFDNAKYSLQPHVVTKFNKSSVYTTSLANYEKNHNLHQYRFPLRSLQIVDMLNVITLYMTADEYYEVIRQGEELEHLRTRVNELVAKSDIDHLKKCLDIFHHTKEVD